MPGIEGKLGSLMSSVSHLADAVDELKHSTQKDHDELTGLQSSINEWKKTIFNKAEEALAAALTAKLHAEKLVDDHRRELSETGSVKSDRAFHVIMALGGVACSLLGAWLAMKFGLSGGGSHASHGP